MEDRKVVSCGDEDQKLFISSRVGAMLHEVALPFLPSCLAVSSTTIATSRRNSVCLVDLEAGSITAALPVPFFPLGLAFDEQGAQLACGMRDGLVVLSPFSHVLMSEQATL